MGCWSSGLAVLVEGAVSNSQSHFPNKTIAVKTHFFHTRNLPRISGQVVILQNDDIVRLRVPSRWYPLLSWKLPGFNFMVRRWFGMRGWGICGEFIVSTVSERQFTMASASTMKVLSVSSLNCGWEATPIRFAQYRSDIPMPQPCGWHGERSSCNVPNRRWIWVLLVS